MPALLRKIMTEYEERAFIAASGQVLTNLLPDNYNDENWTGSEGESIDEWIVAHAWEPFEYWEAKQLWSQISDVATALKSFHKSELEFSLEEAAKHALDIQRKRG